MILRRFMHHVKEQNWFAVGLDVIVVIVGIFLGMQVTEWNDEINRKSDELSILTELEKQLVLYQSLIVTADARYDSNRQAIDTLLSAIHDDAEISEAEFNKLSTQIRRHYRLADATSAFQFLITDESFNLVSESDLKKAISDISAYLSLVEQFEDEETKYINDDYVPFITQYVDQYDAKESERWLKDTSESRFSSDLDFLLNSREFSNILVQRRNKLELVDVFRRAVQRSIESALEIIKEIKK